MTFNTHMRKGITPVIAIVILLMMTVAIVGGFVAFTEGLFDDLIGEAGQSVNTDSKIQGISCAAGGGTIDVTMSNTGSRDIDTSPMQVIVRDESSGDLVATGSATFTSPDDVSAAGEIWKVSGVDPSLTDSAGNPWTFSGGEVYTMQLTFSDQDHSVTESCSP